MTIWAFWGIYITVTIGCTYGQDATTERPTIPVLTVCEVLHDLSQHSGKSLIAVGKLVATEEGRWLVEDCDEKVITDGYKWPNSISLRYLPPSVSKEFTGDVPLLLTKLRQVQRTTRLQVLKESDYSDKWFAVFGHFVTRVPPEVVRGADGKLHGYGFGHLSSSPAQLVAEGNGYRELKPD